MYCMTKWLTRHSNVEFTTVQFLYSAMFNFVTCVENCQVIQVTEGEIVETTDKNNCLCFGMILANTDNSCISWFVVNTYTTERASDRPFSF